jgi:hypothetical protein
MGAALAELLLDPLETAIEVSRSLEPDRHARPTPYKAMAQFHCAVWFDRSPSRFPMTDIGHYWTHRMHAA